jgi:hypothetical protein
VLHVELGKDLRLGARGQTRAVPADKPAQDRSCTTHNNTDGSQAGRSPVGSKHRIVCARRAPALAGWIAAGRLVGLARPSAECERGTGAATRVLTVCAGGP